MKCSKCGAQISTLQVINTKSNIICCKKCDTQMRLKGLWAFLFVPMLLFFLFPYAYLPISLFWSISTLVVSLALTYYVAFRVFVRLSDV